MAFLATKFTCDVCDRIGGNASDRAAAIRAAIAASWTILATKAEPHLVCVGCRKSLGGPTPARKLLERRKREETLTHA